MVIGVCALGCATYYVGSSTYQRYNGMNHSVDHMRAVRRELEADVARLQAQVRLYERPWTRTQRIREKLQMGFKDETIYMY